MHALGQQGQIRKGGGGGGGGGGGHCREDFVFPVKISLSRWFLKKIATAPPPPFKIIPVSGPVQ